MHILVAEDDQVLADALLRALKQAGYTVDQVAGRHVKMLFSRDDFATC